METPVGTSECRSDANLLLWELLLLGATAADWHGLLSFITDTSKLAAFWEMSSVGLFSGVAGTTSVKTLFPVLFPSENLEILSRSLHTAVSSATAALAASHVRQSCIGCACLSPAWLGLSECCSPFIGQCLQLFVCETGNCLIRLPELLRQKWQHWCVTGAPLHYITAVLLG